MMLGDERGRVALNGRSCSDSIPGLWSGQWVNRTQSQPLQVRTCRGREVCGGRPPQSQLWSGCERPQNTGPRPQALSDLPHPHLIPLPPTRDSSGLSSTLQPPAPQTRGHVLQTVPLDNVPSRPPLCSPGGQIQVLWLQDPGFQSPSAIPAAEGLPSGLPF